MCGFMVYTKKDISKEELEKEFKKIKHRGPDMNKIIEKDSNTFLFHRLAIMGLDEKGMQPFEKNNKIVVCNGELYGFRKEKKNLMKKGYTFESESDCEILIPMYETYGIEMFNRLDAEYALVMYDENAKKIIAAR